MRLEQYTPARRQDFIDLNTWWIGRYFGPIEPTDMLEFEGIDDEVRHGGMAFFAVDDDGTALATCAAFDRGDAGWEIAKLGSNPAREHSGCGTAVFEASVAWAEQHGARRIFILTNSALKPATHIYESHGFRRIQTDDFEGYSRGDYALEKVVRQ